jgi:ATP-dependent 26S proteasome regulatory subunit
MTKQTTPATVVAEEPQTKGLKAATDIASLLRARNPILWVATREEGRVERFLVKAIGAAGSKALFWDVDQGVTTPDGKPVKGMTDEDGFNDCAKVFGAIRAAATSTKADDAKRQVWILRDVPIWLEGTGGAASVRKLRNLAKLLPGVPRKQAQAIIILTTDTKVPRDLTDHAKHIEFPLPDRFEIATTFDNAINDIPEFETDVATGEEDKSKPLRANAWTPASRELSIDAAVGLTVEEASSCFAKSLIQSKKIDPVVVSSEKKRVISQAGVLEWIDPVEGGLDAIGGLEEFKDWIRERKDAYSADAKEYGLETPKGVVLVGVQGCGKSLSAKCVPTDWQVPLLRLDLGALKGKYVGESEGNIRKALSVIEAIGRCAVWIDEIEKALGGSAGGGASDGGVATDQLGTLLNWLQERKTEAFVIATANNTDALPPELLRSGRFDAIFGVDVPNETEAKAVLITALKRSKRDKLKINVAEVVKACNKDGFAFISAEIAGLVPTALFAAYHDGKREVTTADLIAAAGKVVPLTKTKQADVEKIRKWIGENARPATRAVTAEDLKVRAGRDLDFG